MSYPDLGCFAECLNCELCEDLEPPADELLPDWDLFDELYPDDGGPFGDEDFWAPPGGPSAGGFLDGLQLPGQDIFGSGVDLSPGVGVGFPIEGTTIGIHLGGSF